MRGWSSDVHHSGSNHQVAGRHQALLSRWEARAIATKTGDSEGLNVCSNEGKNSSSCGHCRAQTLRTAEGWLEMGKTVWNSHEEQALDSPVFAEAGRSSCTHRALGKLFAFHYPFVFSGDLGWYCSAKAAAFPLNSFRSKPTAYKLCDTGNEEESLLAAQRKNNNNDNKRS